MSRDPCDHNLRLLKVAMGLDPAEGGPTEVVVATTLGELEAGFAVTLVTVWTGGAGEAKNVAQLRSAGATVLQFPLAFGARAARRWAISPKAISYVWRHRRKFDVVHVHGVWGLLPLAALFVSRVAGAGVILTPHEALTKYDLDQTPGILQREAKRILRRLVLRLASSAVYASLLELADSPDAGGSGAVVPHPVLAQPMSSRTSVDRASDVLQVGFIGRFHHKKNLGLLLEAVAQLPADSLLVVGGDGSTTEVTQLRELAARLGIVNRVCWLGWLDADARAAFFERVDVVAMPSLYECYGMVAAEAMMSGTAVVVAPRTGVAELVKASGGGRVMSDTSNVSLRSELMGYFEDHEALAMAGRFAQQFAVEHLTPSSYGRKIGGVYRAVLQSTGGR